MVATGYLTAQKMKFSIKNFVNKCSVSVFIPHARICRLAKSPILVKEKYFVKYFARHSLPLSQ